MSKQMPPMSLPPPPAESFEEFEESLKGGVVEHPKPERTKPKKPRRKPLRIATEERPNRGPRKQLEQAVETKRRLTVHLAADIAKSFLMRCAEEDRSISAVTEQAITEYLGREG